jgi:dTDP-4-dehydrorhamnose reductase
LKILLLGSNGQLGYELSHRLPKLGELVICDRSQVDLLESEPLIQFLEKHKPEVIFNTSAYTAVDKAEQEPDKANQVNAKVPKLLSSYLSKNNGLLMHYSTDYVFSGDKKVPYVETDTIAPLNQYGQSKAEGEKHIVDSKAGHLILRTSWVYSSRGNNFIKTMLRLAQERESLKVVSDQISAPTWAGSLADLSMKLIEKAIESKAQAGHWPKGLYHACAPNHTSWHGLAVKALALLRPKLGENWALKSESDIQAIATSEFPLPATRPLDSRMETNALKRDWGLQMPTWEEQLELCLKSWA